MITALVLAGYAVLVGVAAPSALARARWTHRAPGLAILAWLGLMMSFVITTALAVHHLLLTEEHVHDGLVGLLSTCGVLSGASTSVPVPDAADAVALLALAIIVLLPAAQLVRAVWCRRRTQRRHLDMLTVVGRSAPQYGATIVDHDTPAAYCLPGRPRRVVVTRGALEVLSAEQLRAVLEHERGHIAGRHHLIHAATEAFAHSFPWLPLAGHARNQTALLLEMLADDRALRSHSGEVLATAMYELVAGRAPHTALGASGPGAAIRARRALAPQARPHRATWLGVIGASVAVPLLPLLTACGPAVG